MHFTPGDSEPCLICGSSAFAPYRTRSDGRLVVMCHHCGMGVLAEVPADLGTYYGDEYYAVSGETTPVGYADYEFIAEHSVAWAADLVRLLTEPGRILDIGSANGYFLRKLMPEYECHGIEVNARMAEESRSYGVDVVASDIFDPLLADRAGSYDVVTALAVFEHTQDIRRAVEIAAALLKPSGILIFEVPLIAGSVDDGVWFRTSLEHVWYPTERGLDYLFEALGLPLVGKEQEIVDFASTYVGIVARGDSRASVERRFRELASGSSKIAPEDAPFQALFDLVHSGRVDTSTIALVPYLRPEDVNTPLLHRLAALWASHETKQRVAIDDLRERSKVLESGRDEAREQALAARLQRDEIAERLDLMLRSPAARLAARVTAAGKLVDRRTRRLSGLARLFTFRRAGTAIRLLVRGDVRSAKERAGWLIHDELERDAEREHLVLRADPWQPDLPLLSVVVVCFNYGRYVEEAISSVLSQIVVDNCEVIVVDGGSDDPQTVAKMRQLAADPPPRTTVLLRTDGRHLVGDNRNFGIEHASGRYVACLDADDLLDPRYLEIALYLLERRGYDLVSTSTQCFDLTEDSFGLKQSPDLGDLLQANHVTTVAVFRRALWERAGGYQDAGVGVEYVYEDWRLWVRMAALGARVTNIQAPLFRYRVHSAESVSQQHGAARHVAEHRAAVAALNDDVLTAEALAESARRRDLEITVEGAFHNLKVVEDTHRPTILLALPFMVIGGAERLLSEVTKHLAQVGYRIVVVTTVCVEPKFGDSSAWFEDATAEIYNLPGFLRPEYWDDFLEYLVETRGVDIILLAGSEFTYHQLPELRRRHPDLRVADLLFNTQGHVKNNRRYRDEIDLHLCESAEVRDWLIAHGEDKASVRVLESGIDVSAYHPKKRGLELPLRVGFSGRLSEEKAPLAFVDLARMLSSSQCRFLMTGAGPLESKVRRRAAGLPEDSFSFLGVVEDIRAHLASLDVLVLPSVLDGRPVVVLEALAAGVPVIASRVGGLSALVRNGETGFLVEPGDTPGIARHLQHLANDLEELERLRRSARAFAEGNLDAGVMNANYEEALRQLLSEPGREPAGPGSS